MRTTLAPFALAIIASLAAGPAAAIDCDKFIEMHGYLSRAQFECGFEKYSNDVLEQASICAKRMNNKRMRDRLKSGMLQFDEEQKVHSRANACSAVLQRFPTAVAR